MTTIFPHMQHCRPLNAMYHEFFHVLNFLPISSLADMNYPWPNYTQLCMPFASLDELCIGEGLA